MSTTPVSTGLDTKEVALAPLTEMIASGTGIQICPGM
jgi:hypothetical protein